MFRYIAPWITYFRSKLKWQRLELDTKFNLFAYEHQETLPNFLAVCICRFVKICFINFFLMVSSLKYTNKRNSNDSGSISEWKFGHQKQGSALPENAMTISAILHFMHQLYSSFFYFRLFFLQGQSRPYSNFKLLSQRIYGRRLCKDIRLSEWKILLFLS